jgi:ABC-type uncharacterized transport system substrate-binding protein
MELLKEIAPDTKRIFGVFNPETASAPPLDQVIAAAAPLGISATLAPVRDDADIEKVVVSAAHQPGAP